MAEKKFVATEIWIFTSDYASVKGHISRDDKESKHVAEIEIRLSDRERRQLAKFVAAVYCRAWRGVEAQP